MADTGKTNGNGGGFSAPMNVQKAAGAPLTKNSATGGVESVRNTTSLVSQTRKSSITGDTSEVTSNVRDMEKAAQKWKAPKAYTAIDDADTAHERATQARMDAAGAILRPHQQLTQGGSESEKEEMKEGKRLAEEAEYAAKQEQDLLIRAIKKIDEGIIELPKRFRYEKKVKGAGFVIVLIFMIIKDVANLFELTGIAWVVLSVVNLIGAGVMYGYFWFKKIPLGGKKSKIAMVGWVAEEIPFLGFLPTETIAFCWIRYEVNLEEKKKAIDAMNTQIEELKGTREELLTRLAESGGDMSAVALEAPQTKTPGGTSKIAALAPAFGLG